MRFCEYLDTVEGTEREGMLKQKLVDTKDYFSKAINVPIAGKILRALIALGESKSIADFRQTSHYQNIKDWDVTVYSLEGEDFKLNISPSSVHYKKIIKVLLFVAAAIFLFKRYKKRNCIDQALLP